MSSRPRPIGASNGLTLGLIAATGLAGALVGATYMAVLWRLGRWVGAEGVAASPWPRAAMLVGAGALVSLATRWLGSSGSVELLVDNIHVRGGAEGAAELRALLPASLLCIAAGGAAGPEAPLVQTTGTLASWLADARGLDAEQKRTLTITGMSAGFTVLFGAPVGAAIFALEILHRRGLEYYEALLPAIIGSLCGYAAYALMTGLGFSPVWRLPDPGALRALDLLWAAAAGVAAAAVAAAFVAGCRGLGAAFAALPAWMRPPAGGAALALLAAASPYALTYGESQLDQLAAAPAAAAVFALAAAAKLAGMSVTVSSGWKGGVIIPLFFVGACLGRLGHAAFPGANEAVLMTALMAASCAGVTKTPLGSTLVVAGMTGLRLLPTTLIGVMVALALTEPVGFIESQRARAR